MHIETSPALGEDHKFRPMISTDDRSIESFFNVPTPASTSVFLSHIRKTSKCREFGEGAYDAAIA